MATGVLPMSDAIAGHLIGEGARIEAVRYRHPGLRPGVGEGTGPGEARAYQLGGVITQIEVAGSSPGLTYQ